MVKNDLPEKVKAIVWDWNGTLLDDVEQSIHSMNQMLAVRNYPLLALSGYKEIFTFPVKEYYKKAGVNFGEFDWEEVAMEFIQNYRNNVAEAGIQREAGSVLKYFSDHNVRQFVLSAMQQEFLTETIGQRLDAGIFEEIVGLNDHFAHTKLENAMLLIQKIGLPLNSIVMIGDTLHDFEVARAAGIRCVLFSGGHQSHQRLKSAGVPVINNLSDILNILEL
jgi:phosphoglycolate phosphatase